MIGAFCIRSLMEIKQLTSISLGLKSNVLLCLLVMSTNLVAASAIYEIVDQQGNPLSQAVLVNAAMPVSKIDPIPAIMDQINKQFLPSVIAIRQGRSVTFPNSDNIRHHVYSFSKPKRFTIKLYANRPQPPIVFDQPGLVVVGCNIHDKMIGYIFVSEWDEFVISDENGKANFEQDLPLPTALKVWHPDMEDPTQLLNISNLEKTREGKSRIVLKVTNPGGAKIIPKVYDK